MVACTYEESQFSSRNLDNFQELAGQIGVTAL